jgi:hypothetical protein
MRCRGRRWFVTWAALGAILGVAACAPVRPAPTSDTLYDLHQRIAGQDLELARRGIFWESAGSGTMEGLRDALVAQGRLIHHRVVVPAAHWSPARVQAFIAAVREPMIHAVYRPEGPGPATVEIEWYLIPNRHDQAVILIDRISRDDQVPGEAAPWPTTWEQWPPDERRATIRNALAGSSASSAEWRIRAPIPG